ncbi:MAG: HEAT repeat domain-containing protein [Verrucomicrobiales bacterium]|nr:HEAT repeat domain-containing protein [Verrucomicrobiales bacterium]
MNLKAILAGMLLGLCLAAPTLGQAPTPLLAQSAAQCLDVLRSTNATLKDRVDACRQLATLGGKDAIPVLAPLLLDPQLSDMARYALEPNPDPSVTAVLRDALPKAKGRQLVGVITSLGVRRDPLAVPALAALLDHSDAEVAQATARAMGSIGTSEAALALLTATEYAPSGNLVAFCEGLARCAENRVAAGHPDEALAIYDHYEDAWLPNQVRQAALRGAILTRGAGGLALMRQALAAPEYILFAAAARTALEMKDPAVTPVLVAVLSSLSEDRQVVVADTLGQRGDPAGAKALLTLTQSGTPAARVAAVQALGRLAGPTTMPMLEGLLSSPDQAVRDAAREAYASLRGAEVDRAVLDMLRDLDPDTQLLAIELVKRRHMTKALPGLLQAAAGNQAAVRPAAIRAVAELGGADQLNAVLDLLMTTQVATDREAAEAAAGQLCARAESPEALTGAVIDRLGRGTPAQRQALVRLLGSIGGGQALQAVRSSLKDSDVGVRGIALRTLADWHTADAAPALLAIAREPATPTDKVVALRGYLRLAAQAEMGVADRLALCREAAPLIQRDDEKRLLLGALGAIISSESVDLISPFLADPDVSGEAAAAMLRLADELLKRDNAPAARALIEPLEKIAGMDHENLAKRAGDLLKQAREKAK